MDWQAPEAIGTTTAAVVAIGYGLYEYRSRYVAKLDERVAEVQAVTLTYQLPVRPRLSEVRNGKGEYVYRFTVHNPGRLPITDVTANMIYPGEIERVHSDEAQTVDKPSSTEEMRVASVAGHGQYTWARRLRVKVELWPKMEKHNGENQLHRRRCRFLRNDLARGAYISEQATPKTVDSKVGRQVKRNVLIHTGHGDERP